MANLIASEVVGNWALPTPVTTHEEECNYQKKTMRSTTAEKTNYIPSQINTNNNAGE